MSYSSGEGVDEGLGIDIFSAGTSIIGGLFGGGKDDGRLRTNQEAYNAAINGNGPFKEYPTALDFLRTMSTSWATDKAKNDARAKYTAALNIINQQKAAAAASRPATPTLYPSPVSAGGGVMGGPVVAGLSVAPLMMAGLAASALYFLTRRR